MDISYVLTAILEGFTEFIPVSSTGHLIILGHWLNIETNNFWKSFEIAIQMGAIMAVGSLYLKRLLENVTAWGKLIAAFIPTGLIGYFAYGFVKNHLLENVYLTAVMLFLGGVAIIFLEKRMGEKPAEIRKWTEVSYAKAVGIGIIQSLSLVPGVSRAAATILGAGYLGFSRTAAVEFSFLLALPTMAAAVGWDLLKTGATFSSQEWLTMLYGIIIAFVTARLSVVWLLKFVKNYSLGIFGWYRIILAGVVWLLA